MAQFNRLHNWLDAFLSYVENVKGNSKRFRVLEDLAYADDDVWFTIVFHDRHSKARYMLVFDIINKELSICLWRGEELGWEWTKVTRYHSLKTILEKVKP